MIRKLFGESKEDQFKYLGWRTLLSIVVIVISGILALCGEESIAGGIILTVMFIVWGIPAIRVGLNFLSKALPFSNNVVIHVLLFMVALGIAYILGAGIAILGIVRCIQLFISRIISKNKVQN